MRYFLSFILLLIVHSGFSQTKGFDFKKVWELVYQQELEGKPKRASVLVDSIYTAASESELEDQMLKALIYQSKFMVILEEEGQSAVIRRFSEVATQNKGHLKRITQSILAGIFKDYYQRNSYRIRQRTDSDFISPDFKEWGESSFRNVIDSLYMSSLDFQENELNTPLQDFEEVIETDDFDLKYRPLLLDFLAFRALEYFRNYNRDMPHELLTLRMNPALIGSHEDFADVDIAGYAPAGALVRMVQIFQKLERLHRHDTTSEARVDIILNRLKMFSNQLMLSDNERIRITTLDELIKRYNADEAVARLLFEKARVLKTQGDKYSEENPVYQYEYNKALEVCEKASDSFPKSLGASQCKVLGGEILDPSLRVNLAEVMLPQRPAKMLITYNNVEQVYFTTYRVSPDSVFLNGLSFNGDERQKTLSSLEEVNSWSVSLRNESDHRSRDTEVVFPRHSEGQYFIVVTNDEQRKNLLAWDSFQVSNLSAFKVGEDSVGKLFQVLDRTYGKALSGISVTPLLRNNRGENIKSARPLVSDKDGHFRYNPTSSGGENVRFLLEKGEHRLYTPYSYMYNRVRRAEPEIDEYNTSLNIFTDRAIYRPSQKVYFKLILAKLNFEGKSVFPGQELTVFLNDVNDQRIDSLQVTTNDFGSATGQFELPAAGQTGEYSLEVNQETTGEAAEDFEDIVAAKAIRVEAYKKPTFEVFVSSENESYSLGDSLFFRGTARGFAGNSLVGARVKYNVVRRAANRYNYDYNRFDLSFGAHQVAQGTTTTNAMGEFDIVSVEKDTVSLFFQEGMAFTYILEVEVTDLNGETQRASKGVTVGQTAFKVNILVGDMDIQQSSPDMTVRAYNMDMEPRELKGLLSIIKLKSPTSVKRDSPWTTPYYTDISKERHERLFPNYPYRDELAINQWPEEKVYFSDSIYTSHISPPDLGNFSTWAKGHYKVKFSALDPSGDTLTAVGNFKLSDYESLNLQAHELFDMSIEKPGYEVGQIARLKLGTAAKKLTVYVQIKAEDMNPGDWQVFELSNERQELSLPVTGQDKKGIDIYYYYVYENTLTTGTKRIKIVEKSRDLEIKLGTYRNLLEPGVKEQWQLSIHGPTEEAAEAELLASMYDASLDALTVHQWRPDFTMFRYSFSQHPVGFSDAFGNTASQSLLNNRYRLIPSPDYSQLKWFGFDFMNASWVNNRYLEKLRWRHKPWPFVKASKRDLPEGIISGLVIDELAQPAADITIRLPDGNTTQTRANGTFTIKKGQARSFKIAFAGYLTFNFNIENNNYFEIQLIADSDKADQVTVVGYGDQSKRDLPASLSYAIVEEVADEEEVLESALFYRDIADGDNLEVKSYSSRPPTLEELGMVSAQTIIERVKSRFPDFDPENPPLTFQDGVGVDLTTLGPVEVYSVKVLTAEKAMALYGESGSNGALLITTANGLREQAAQLDGIKARTDLKETAFFFPQLKTDQEGNIAFSFTSPEALTRWKLQLLAHDKSLNTGQLIKEVHTQKSLMVIPNVPRFFREGDQFIFNAKMVSLSTDTLDGFARLEFQNTLTGKPVQLYADNSQPTLQFRLLPNGSQALEWTLTIPDGLEAVTYRIVASAGSFTDGEESIIPVLTNRVMVQESLPMWVRAGEKKSFSLNKLKTNNSSTLEHHRLSLNLTSNPVWEAIRSLPYLMEYPYECVEQTFARFYANALGSYLLKSQPEIRNALAQWSTQMPVSKLEQNPELKALLIQETPWVREAQTQKQQQERLALLLDAGRMETELSSQLANLRQMQMASGAFPWFKGGRENRYITSHVLAGLWHLSKLTDHHIFGDILAKGNDYLDRTMIGDYTEWEKEPGQERKISYEQAQYLYVHSFDPGRERKELLAEAIAHYQKLAFETWLQMDLQSQAMIALFAHRTGQVAKAQQIANSIKEYSINSEEKGTFWKANVSGWYNYEAPIETQALLIEMFEELGENTDFIDELKQWLLSEKRTKAWKSTKATTEAIYALLLNGEDQLKPNRKVWVKLGGKRVLNTRGKGTDTLVGYHSVLWNGASVKPKMAKVQIRNKGNSVAFGALHWQYFEELAQITPSVGPLSLQKEIFKVVKSTDGERLISLSREPLQLGDLVRVRMVLKSDRSMEFIHLKDMRASGLEPVNVLSGYRWQDGLSYYESTRDAATHFFIERLPQGTFVFEYDLRVNIKGTFSNGITSIQNMYAPEFSSHSKGLTLEIKE